MVTDKATIYIDVKLKYDVACRRSISNKTYLEFILTDSKG